MTAGIYINKGHGEQLKQQHHAQKQKNASNFYIVMEKTETADGFNSKPQPIIHL
jgi:hypothetical protein